MDQSALIARIIQLEQALESVSFRHDKMLALDQGSPGNNNLDMSNNQNIVDNDPHNNTKTIAEIKKPSPTTKRCEQIVDWAAYQSLHQPQTSTVTDLSTQDKAHNNEELTKFELEKMLFVLEKEKFYHEQQRAQFALDQRERALMERENQVKDDRKWLEETLKLFYQQQYSLNGLYNHHPTRNNQNGNQMNESYLLFHDNLDREMHRILSTSNDLNAIEGKGLIKSKGDDQGDVVDVIDAPVTPLISLSLVSSLKKFFVQRTCDLETTEEEYTKLAHALKSTGKKLAKKHNSLIRWEKDVKRRFKKVRSFQRGVAKWGIFMKKHSKRINDLLGDKKRLMLFRKMIRVHQERHFGKSDVKMTRAHRSMIWNQMGWDLIKVFWNRQLAPQNRAQIPISITTSINNQNDVSITTHYPSNLPHLTSTLLTHLNPRPTTPTDQLKFYVSSQLVNKGEWFQFYGPGTADIIRSDGQKQQHSIYSMIDPFQYLKLPETTGPYYAHSSSNTNYNSSYYSSYSSHCHHPDPFNGNFNPLTPLPVRLEFKIE